MQLRAATPDDFENVLALNQESVEYLSPLDENGLAHLHEQAALHLVALEDGVVTAFLLVLGAGANYDSPNYQWFCQRYARFLYVDRVVVARSAAGRGAGAQLYRALFELAGQQSIPLITCEYNLEPPNAASAGFHSRFGFVEVGRQWVASGKKLVSLQVAQL